MKQFEESFGRLVIRFRWLVLIGLILVVGAISSGMANLKFVNDGRVFFSKENPQLQALEALENTYTKNENVLFAIAPKDGTVFTKKTLAAVEELTEASWRIPFSNRVDSITNYQHTVAEDDDLIVDDLVRDAMNLTGEDIDRIRKIALNEPLLVNRIVSDKGHVTGVNINILKPGLAGNESPIVTNFARELAIKFRADHPDIDLYLTGGIIMDTAFGEASAEDGATLLPVMFGVIFVLLGLLLRSISGIFSTLLVLIMSVVTGLGIAGFLGIALTPASANAPTIILTLAVADSIHLLVTMFHEMRAGKEKREAIIESVRVNLQPVFLTSVTTAIGFSTMNFSDAPPFRDLGNIVAMGVIAAFFYSVLFLPALMSILPLRIKARSEETADFYCADCFGDFVVKQRNGIFWSMLGVMFVLISGTAFIELDDNFVKYFDTRYDFRRASDFVAENLSGMDIIEYSLDSGSPNGINDPEYLKKVEEFTNWYRTQPSVANVMSLTDIFKRLNKNMHGDDPAFYRIPENRELAAQYLLLYEMSLPYGLDLNNQINIDKSSTRLVVTLSGTTAKELRNMDDKARDWLKTNAPERMFTYGAGISVMWANISKRNIDSMLFGSFLALTLISLILVFALRSFKLGAISLIPNLAPAFMAFGVWGFVEGRVGLAVSVLVALTLGIVVDDTVHFMSKYLRARREHGHTPAEAVRYSFHTVGVALTISTVVLVAGFTVLAFSGFKVNSDMGAMTAITITLALILDFLLLPTLLMKIEEKN